MTTRKTMIDLDGVYQGMPLEEYVDILESYIAYLENALSPVSGMMKVILPLPVEDDDVEVH